MGDIVLMEDGVGEILFHCQYLHHILTCVTFYEKDAKPNRFRIVKDNFAYIPTTSILGPCIVRLDEAFITVAPQDFAVRSAK